MERVQERLVYRDRMDLFTIGQFYLDREQTQVGNTVLTIRGIPKKDAHFNEVLSHLVQEAIAEYELTDVVVRNCVLTRSLLQNLFRMLLNSQAENLLSVIFERIELDTDLADDIFVFLTAFYTRCPNLQHVTFLVPPTFTIENPRLMEFVQCFATGIPIVEVSYAKVGDSEAIPFSFDYRWIECVRAIPRYTTKFPRVLFWNLSIVSRKNFIEEGGLIPPLDTYTRIYSGVPYTRDPVPLFESIVINGVVLNPRNPKQEIPLVGKIPTVNTPTAGFVKTPIVRLPMNDY